LFLPLATASFALKKGDNLPSLSGITLSGEQFNLQSLKGNPILLKLGTTWCPTCGQEAAEIDLIRDFMLENDIKFVEVFIQESPSTVNSYLTRSDHKRPDVVILDDGNIAKALAVYQIPRIMLINSDMQVFSDGGPMMSDLLKQRLQKMLTEK